MYDVIIVGAGGSGSPLASRLSEDPTRRVLLVEAGPAYPTTKSFPEELLDAVLLTSSLPGHEKSWRYDAQLTADLSYSVPRGKALGGSTSVNGAYFVRARKSDFDRWSVDNPEWSYEKVLPFYKRLEQDLDYGETEVHGGSGPMLVDRALSEPDPLILAFYAACATLGFEEEPDKNAQGRPGYGPLPMNAPDGLRLNTGIAYINPHRNRANLTVRGDTSAQRIVFDGTRATGLEVKTNGDVETLHLNQSGEVILSAGAINSPHLLALSGIGPRAELEPLGIAVVSDRPGLGKNFSDHLELLLAWKPCEQPSGPEPRRLFQGSLNFTAADSPYEGDLEIFPGLTSFGTTMGSSHGDQLDNMFLAISLQHPESRGTITTVSADPLVQPLIDYNYLSTEADRSRLRELVRTSATILRSEELKPYVSDLLDLEQTALDDDAAVDAWTRAHLGSAIHASGTARMGPADDPQAVVDQYGRPHGVTGVRVADTSILPTVPTRGPAATAVMIGERIADFVRAG
jgi:predicted dehydrogenase (TIGR03970 family)